MNPQATYPVPTKGDDGSQRSQQVARAAPFQVDRVIWMIREYPGAFAGAVAPSTFALAGIAGTMVLARRTFAFGNENWFALAYVGAAGLSLWCILILGLPCAALATQLAQNGHARLGDAYGPLLRRWARLLWAAVLVLLLLAFGFGTCGLGLLLTANRICTVPIVAALDASPRLWYRSRQLNSEGFRPVLNLGPPIVLILIGGLFVVFMPRGIAQALRSLHPGAAEMVQMAVPWVEVPGLFLLAALATILWNGGVSLLHGEFLRFREGTHLLQAIQELRERLLPAESSGNDTLD